MTKKSIQTSNLKMNKPKMKLSELIAEIGDANVSFQMLSDSLKGKQRQEKGHITVTIGVSEITLGDLIASEPSKVGMILWLPGDKFREIQKRITK